MATYTLRVRERFEAAHHLRSYRGEPEPVQPRNTCCEAKSWEKGPRCHVGLIAGILLRRELKRQKAIWTVRSLRLTRRNGNMSEGLFLIYAPQQR